MLDRSELADSYRRVATLYDSYASDYHRSPMERATWVDSAQEMRRRADDVEGAH